MHHRTCLFHLGSDQVPSPMSESWWNIKHCAWDDRSFNNHVGSDKILIGKSLLSYKLKCRYGTGWYHGVIWGALKWMSGAERDRVTHTVASWVLSDEGDAVRGRGCWRWVESWPSEIWAISVNMTSFTHWEIKVLKSAFSSQGTHERH